MDNIKFTDTKDMLTSDEGWDERGYEPILDDKGNLYQFYTFVNKKTGEKRVQIAKYVADGEYIPLEQILPFFKNNEDIVMSLFE